MIATQNQDQGKPVTGPSGNGKETAMVLLKQVEIYGQRFEFRSIDGGRTWSSEPRSLIAYKRRKEAARADVQKRFAEMAEDVGGPDPDEWFELNLPDGSVGDS